MPLIGGDDRDAGDVGSGGGVIFENGDEGGVGFDGLAEEGQHFLRVFSGPVEGDGCAGGEGLEAVLEALEVGQGAAELGGDAPVGIPVAIAGGFGFLPGEVDVGEGDGVGVFEVKREGFGNVDEAFAGGGEPEPEFVIAGGAQGGVEESVAVVEGLAPQGVRAEETGFEEGVAVEVGPGEAAGARGLEEGGVLVGGDVAVGVGGGGVGVVIEGGGEEFEAAGIVAIVDVGVSEVGAAGVAGQGDGAVPGGVERFAFGGADVADLAGVLDGELGDDGGFVFGGGGVDDEDFELAAGEKCLCDEVLEAAADEALAAEGGDDGGYSNHWIHPSVIGQVAVVALKFGVRGRPPIQKNVLDGAGGWRV